MRVQRIVLIGCGKAKRAEPCEAHELYTGGLFRDRLDYARHSRSDWFVLSAFYGLVVECQYLAPYDLTLQQLNEVERAMWCTAVAGHLLKRVSVKQLAGVEVEIHAGRAYADQLGSVLSALGLTISTPLAGLQIGQQRHWYAVRRGDSHAKGR